MSYFKTIFFKKTNFSQGQLKIHETENDSNPSILIGQNSLNTLEIKSNYNSSSNTLDFVNFTTKTTSGVTDGGKMAFNVDSVKMKNKYSSLLCNEAFPSNYYLSLMVRVSVLLLLMIRK